MTESFKLPQGSRMRLYVLNEANEPVPESDLLQWGLWFVHHPGQHHLAVDRVGERTVSTIFMGIDMGLGWLRDDAPKILYETLVFGPGPTEVDGRRYETREQALAGHQAYLDQLRRPVH